MTPSEPRTRSCTPEIARGRLRKAEQFAVAFDTIIEFAENPGDVSDACATLAVHAGIASADVLCCARLGRHALGESHADAVNLLNAAAPELTRHLRTLLGLKTLAGYGHEPVSRADCSAPQRAMDALLTGARAARR